jgi:hypothetical protein
MPETAERRIAHFAKLGDECMAKSDCAGAYDHYQKGLESARDHYGLHHAKLIPLLAKAAEASLKDRRRLVEKRLNEAVELYRWILAIQETVLGFDHADLLPMLQVLSICYDQQGQHIMASELARRVRVIRRR